MSHLKWMKEALNVANKALAFKEVPVGCVIVYEDTSIIGQGHNLTNVLKNPTRHAEFEAIGELECLYFKLIFHHKNKCELIISKMLCKNDHL